VHVQSDINLSDVPVALRSLRIDHSVSPVRRFHGGTSRARARLNAYLAEPFAHYAKNRSVPEAGAASHMSPYLHFGQISPVEIALAVRDTKTGDDEDRSAYLEELIVRRELAMNHVFYDERYDAYEGPCRNGPARRSTAGAAIHVRTSTRASSSKPATRTTATGMRP
jgi:deoxyribodipyrimidine photo-lyase